jgi:hypothetical protein
MLDILCVVVWCCVSWCCVSWCCVSWCMGQLRLLVRLLEPLKVNEPDLEQCHAPVRPISTAAMHELLSIWFQHLQHLQQLRPLLPHSFLRPASSSRLKCCSMSVSLASRWPLLNHSVTAWSFLSGRAVHVGATSRPVRPFTLFHVDQVVVRRKTLLLDIPMAAADTLPIIGRLLPCPVVDETPDLHSIPLRPGSHWHSVVFLPMSTRFDHVMGMFRCVSRACG